MTEQGLAVFNDTVFTLLAALHLYWIFGGRWGLDASVPTDSNGRKLFRPSRMATLVVAIGLLPFAVCNMVVAGWLTVAGSDPLRQDAAAGRPAERMMENYKKCYI